VAEHGSCRSRSTSENGRIFVQIASYRDPELLPTLRDCIAKASRPDLLRFGIAWQHDEAETLAEFAGDRRVKVVECDWRASEGVCWARHNLQKLYEGEEFTLALDSHHRFEWRWDEQLKGEFASLPSPKPVLTGYLPSYEPDKPIEPSARTVLMLADKFEDGILLFVAKRVRLSGNRMAPVAARFFSAHFAFSRGSFLQDCPHDPQLYFLGEEITLAVRAYTHGYDLFHPVRPAIHHHYGRDGRPKHWDDHPLVPGQSFGSRLRDYMSKARARALLGIEESPADFGRFGLGDARSLADYERHAGIGFKERWISDAARNGKPPGP
jgi:hypothetical protein